MMKKYRFLSIFVFFYIFSTVAFGGYMITPFSNQVFCVSAFPSAYNNTVLFSIDETTNGGFAASQANNTLVLTLPAGFEFNTAAPSTVTFTAGRDITALTLTSITASSITIEVTTDGNANQRDRILFNNFEVRATAAGSGDLLRLSPTLGTFLVDGSINNPGDGNPNAIQSFGNLSASLAMTYNSSAVSQYSTADINRNCTSTRNPILEIQVNVTANSCASSITQFNFNTTGDAGYSQNPGTNITKARVFYTGQTPGYNNVYFFGSVNNPNGAFTINGSQQLLNGTGTYYFYLTYDIAGSANVNDRIDASITSFVLDGNVISDMSTPNPAGTRNIVSAVCPPQPDLPNPPPNFETIPINSLVIPMDNVNQAVVSPFNLKAYGLVNALLQNDIPVKWVMKSGKIKDEIDFSATAARIYPSALAAALINFRASAFIIDSMYVNASSYSSGKTATEVITAFGSNVAVYQLTTDVVADVRYTLNQRPKIACFNNGGTQILHTKILDAAGIPNYVEIDAGVFTGLAECYTFCSEAHWKSTDIADTAITNRIREFVVSGGNFYSQCRGVLTYENYSFFHSTQGIDIENATVTNAYYNNDMAFMQFHGNVVSNQAGSERNWVKSSGSWQDGFYYAISSSTNLDTVVAGAAHLAPPDSIGGNVFFLGGHDYFANGAADWANITHLNAARMYLNAALIPARRPTAFAVNSGINQTICSGEAVMLGGAPTGPPGSTYSWSPSANLNNNTAANPIANPTVTTIYDVVVSNGGCSATATSSVIVNPSPVNMTVGPSATLCYGQSTILTADGATTYSWAPSSGLNSTTGSSVIANPTTSTTYTVTGSMGNCLRELTVTITINPLQSISVSPSTTVCYGASAILTASGATTYTWAPFIGLSSTTGASVITTPVANTTYTVTGTTGGCSASASIVVITNPSLSVNVPADSVTCITTATLTAIGNGGSGGYRYLWNTNASTSSISVNSGTYIITLTDASGCIAKDTSVVTAPPGNVSATISQPANLCKGATTSITVTATDGFGGYSYLWDTGETTVSITAGEGNHCVTVTDIGGCITSACVTINEDSLLIANIASPAQICIGASTTISALAEGGQAPYTFLWNTGETTNSIFKPAGTYSVIVTDANANSCRANAMVTIVEETSLSVTISNSINASCFGGNNGSATALATDGVPGYTYFWLPVGGTDAIASNLPAATYTVIVTDSIGCLKEASTTITQPTAALSASFTVVPVSCKSGNNGSATVLAYDGTPGYSYFWSGGSTGTTINGLVAGNYTVTITDANSCVITNTITITEPNLLTSLITNSVNVSCQGGNDGSATVTPAGGTTPYSYLWNTAPAQTGTIATGLAAGIYSVVVTDFNGCNTSSTLTITEPILLTSSITDSENVNCNGGNDGSATVTPAGGTASYGYLWNTVPAQTTAMATGLFAGTYSVTVTDFKGCISLSTITITENTPLVISGLADNMISCTLLTILTPTVTGGDGNYAYLWNNGATDASITVTTGSYILTATDGLGCFIKDTVDIIALNSTLGVSITAPTNICFGSTTTISAVITPGSANYNYIWSNGSTVNTASTTNEMTVGSGIHCVTIRDNDECLANACVNIIENPLLEVIIPADTICIGATTAIIPNVSGGAPLYGYLWSTGETTQNIIQPAGTYTLEVSDAIFCTTTTNVTIVNAPDISLTYTNSNLSCFKENNGISQVNVSGGTPGYTYLWSTGDTEDVISGLAAESYSVTVVDARGCSKMGSTLILQPDSLTIDTTGVTHVSCFGQPEGAASVLASGGTTPYAYLWTIIGKTTATVTGLYAGTYFAIVTDANACDASKPVYITEPSLLNATITSRTNVSCKDGNDGSAIVAASGGTAPYTYSWSPSGGATPTASMLVSDNYIATITDANNCLKTASVMVTEPAVLNVVLSSVNATCGLPNGSASASVSGGTTPYSYLWSNGTTASANNGIIGGTYSLTVTDANGCIDQDAISINNIGTLISITSTVTNVSCSGDNDGEISVTVSSGIPPYTYEWQNLSNTGTMITGLIANNYTLTATGNDGCSTTQIIPVTEPLPLTLTVNSTNVSCFGEDDGRAFALSSGGTAPYTYSWSPTGGISATETGLAPNTYSATVSDAKGCTASANVNIAEPAILATTISGSANVSCFGGNDGSATVNPSGGTPPYLYSWSPNGGSSFSAVNMAANTYTVNLTDNNGCVAFISVIITEPAILTATINKTDVSCNGGNDGTAIAIPTGGTSPYSYSWFPTGDISSTATGLTAATYTATVTDANNCITSVNVNITEPTAIITSVQNPDTICSGFSTIISASASGGNSGYSYTWSSLSGTSASQSVNPATSTSYSVIAIDNTGCMGTQEVIIVPVVSLEPANLTVIGAITICYGESTLISANISGNPGYAEIKWCDLLNYDTTLGPFTVSPTATTTYSLSITNECGDSVSSAVTITVVPLPVISISPQTISGCAAATLTYTDSSEANIGASYYWDFGDGGTKSTLANPTHTYIQEGNYKVRITITSIYGCVNTDSTTCNVTIYPLPQANFTPNPRIASIDDPIINFTSNSPEAISWLWNFGDDSTSIKTNPSHTYQRSGVYEVTLIIMNQWQCIDSTIEIIQILPESSFYIPNSFTPNGDGINDFFNVSGLNITEFSMVIYDRWGELLFKTDKMDHGWDGKAKSERTNNQYEMVPISVYVYKVKLKDIRGKEHSSTGHINLLR